MENTTDLTQESSPEEQKQLDEMEATETIETKDVSDESLQESLDEKYDNEPKKTWDIEQDQQQYFVTFKDGNGVYEMEITKREFNTLSKL